MRIAVAQDNHRKKEALSDGLFLLFLLAIFFISSVPLLDLPGFGDEEAFLVHPVVSMLKGIPSEHLLMELFHHKIFLMVCAWVGSVCALLFFPSLSLFGCNMYVIRLTRIFYGFVTIISLYYFVKCFFDKRTARICAFFMATMPYYIFMYRHGYLDDGILPFFLFASLFSFYLFYQSGGKAFFYLGAFFRDGSDF